MILTYVITGAHGTGKTTLLNELTFFSDQYSFSQSSTRSSGAKLNEEGNDASQLQILESIKQYELDNDLYKKDFILDRSFIDFYAYSRHLHSIGNVSDEVLEQIKTEFITRLDRYTMVFFLPVEFDIENDGVRSTDHEFQKSINDHIWNIICEYELGAVIASGSVEDRVAVIKHHVPYITQITSKHDLTNLIDVGEGEEYLDNDSYVVMHQERVVSLLSYKRSDRLKISYLFTNPTYRGYGFATKLMNRLLADNKNIVVYLYIKDDAMRFYKLYGIDKFIVGESIYSGPKPNYFATFFNGDELQSIDTDQADITARLKQI